MFLEQPWYRSAVRIHGAMAESPGPFAVMRGAKRRTLSSGLRSCTETSPGAEDEASKARKSCLVASSDQVPAFEDTLGKSVIQFLTRIVTPPTLPGKSRRGRGRDFRDHVMFLDGGDGESRVERVPARIVAALV